VRGLSADGRVAVGGASGSADGGHAFYWTQQEGMVPLGSLPGGQGTEVATPVSADGSIIYGLAPRPTSGYDLFRWTRAGGAERLGPLPGEAHYGQLGGASGDGSVFVGDASVGPQGATVEAFRYTPGAGATFLGTLPDRRAWSSAIGISRDGSTVVGLAAVEVTFQAVRWTSAGIESLGALPAGPTFSSAAYAASADGSVVVGEVLSSPSDESAFIWREGQGMTPLGRPPGAAASSARAVSDDGRVVIGGARLGDQVVGFVWDVDHGMRSMFDALRDYGLDSTGWTELAPGWISADGTVVAGDGRRPDGHIEGFVAVLPEPAGLLSTCCCTALLLRRRRM
jgi:uncharacterized membrane protein